MPPAMAAHVASTAGPSLFSTHTTHTTTSLASKHSLTLLPTHTHTPTQTQSTKQASMRVLFPAALLATVLGMAAASKPLLPRTMWERKARTDKRRAESGDKPTLTSTEELREMLNINDGTLAGFSKVAMDLVR